MIKIFKEYKLLILILIIAATLRIWQFGSIPPHLTPDEASLGYNAYSILKTGKDEYGKFLPIIFKSFGDYKPGLYVYLTVPFVATLGLNEFAVRLPSALAGILSVYLIYLITRQLFNSLETGKWKLEIVAAFVAAINPWSIFFSRGAWEVNVSLMFTLLGIYFFFKSLQAAYYLLPATVAFGATLLTYQGAKLSTGIVVLILLVVYWKDFIKINKKYLLAGFGLAAVLAFPIIFSIFRGQTGRLEIFSVFSYPRPKEYLQSFLNEGREKIGGLNYYLFHSEALNFKRGILGRYFNHFSGRFLFFEGDWANPSHSAPYQGMLLLTDIVLLLYGFIVIFRSKLEKGHIFVLLWLLLAPLPAVLSRDQVHAVRALNMSVPLILVMALGLRELISRSVNMIPPPEWNSPSVLSSGSKDFTHRGVIIFIALLYITGIVYFLDAYFIHLPKHNSQYWYYGYKQIVETITPVQSNYKTIKVQQSFAQPYIYFLFFQKYDPAKYQKQANLVSSEFKNDVGYVTRLDNIEFVPIGWSIDRGDHGDLIVADTVRIPVEDSNDEKLFKVIKEIKYLNGRDVAFRIIEVR